MAGLPSVLQTASVRNANGNGVERTQQRERRGGWFQPEEEGRQHAGGPRTPGPAAGLGRPAAVAGHRAARGFVGVAEGSVGRDVGEDGAESSATGLG